MASCEFLSRLACAIKREFSSSLPPEEDRAVRAGNKLFSDQQSGILDTSDKVQERLEQLESLGVNVPRALEQSATMRAAQNSDLTFRS